MLIYIPILLKVKQSYSFMYCLFNDAVSNSSYGTSNALSLIMILIELFALKDMKYRPVLFMKYDCF
jgi:hypothetical protein